MMEEENNLNENRSSKFSAAEFTANRINDILERINYCKLNPKAMNEQHQEINYILWFNSVCILYDEVECFMTNQEREKVLKMINALQEFIYKHPVHEQKHIDNPNNKVVVSNENHWRIIKRCLEELEREVKRFGIKYNITGMKSEIKHLQKVIT